MELVENDKSGNYRLNPAVTIADIEFKALTAHWDARVTELAAEVQKVWPNES